MTYKNTFIFFMITLTLGLAMGTTFLSYQPEVMKAVQPVSLPDAFMEKATALLLDKQGKVSMKIMTAKLVHYAEDDTTYLTTPTVTLYRQSSPMPWYITANTAKATQGTDTIFFQNNVVIHHPADENNPTTQIKTTTLTVYPNKRIAETSDLITLLQPNMTVKATGMHANMDTGDVKLLSQARGEYVPSS